MGLRKILVLTVSGSWNEWDCDTIWRRKLQAADSRQINWMHKNIQE